MRISISGGKRYAGHPECDSPAKDVTLPVVSIPVPRARLAAALLPLVVLAPAGAAQAASPPRVGPLTIVPERTAVRTAAGWQTGRRVRVTVDGARIRVRAAGGVRATAVRLAFAAAPGERFYGLGERADAVDHRGATVENVVSDGPFTPDTYDVVKNTIPPAGFRARRDATYYPVPWTLSSRGYGVLLENDQASRFDLADASRKAWSIEVDAPALTARVFDGRGSMARALAAFTRATGRQPAPGAPWAFGPWFQTGQPNTVPLADEAAWLAKLRAADAPVSAAETQLRYLPCGLDRGNEDYERRRVAAFHAAGLAVLTYVNPMLCQSYEPLWSAAVAAGALQKRAGGTPATFNAFVGGTGPLGFTIQPVAQFDFATVAGRAQYGAVLRRMAGAGHDGWMEDFGEYTPADVAGAADGLHNRYPTQYHCAAAAIAKGIDKPIVRFQRSGWTGAAKCASDVWGGDPTTSFGFDGLSSAVKEALGMGLSGVSRWGSDIGGYDTIQPDPRLTPELLKRWIELGAVSGVMRTKSSGLAIPGYQRPQIWDDDVIGTWRRYAKLHTQLYPYILAADRTYRSTGTPLMRHLALAFPGQPDGGQSDSEFLFGPSLLAAPVVKAGATSRKVRLPRGTWIDGTHALAYNNDDGSFHARAGGLLRGGRTITARAGVGTLPLYVRAGSVLPLLDADVDTLADTGATPAGVVRLKDRADRLRLLAFPAPGTTDATIYDGEPVRSRVRDGAWTLTVHGSRARTYEVEAPLGRIPGRHGACRVTGATTRSVQDGVLHAVVAGRTATLRVRGRC